MNHPTTPRLQIRRILPLTRQINILLYAVALGLAVGFISLAYRWSFKSCGTVFRGAFDSLPVNLIFLMPVAGSVLLILVVKVLRAEVREYVPEVIESSIRNTALRLKDGLVCFVTSALTLGSGGSAGPEGPMAFTGASVGSALGRRLRLDNRHAKILLGAGAAAGIAAMFNAPLAGVLFALELILFNDLTMSAVTPVILSSVAASAVSFHFLGDHPTFRVPLFAMNSYLELFAYAVLGVAGGFVSALFCRTMHLAGRFFHHLRLGTATPVLGALVVGGLLVFIPRVGGYGHDAIDAILHGEGTLPFFTALVFFKILATALTLQSGNSGGIFAPALLIGAALGAGVGGGLQLTFPGAGSVEAYALIGMAAVMAGTIHTPLTAMMLIFELTRDYHTILPLMTVTVISTLVAYGMGSESLYIAPLSRKKLDFRMIRDLGSLGDVHAVNLMRHHFAAVRPGDSPAEIRRKLQRYPYKRALYLTTDDRLLGYLSLDTLHLLDTFSLDELSQSFRQVIHPQDTLYETLHKLRTAEGILPVVDEGGRVRGIISNKIFIEKYLPLLKVSSAKRSGI
ncbi:MAG: chloride channel protein [Acidobacteria bacterium]|nr:chloride channel protein [Acidobacteriota bacterium]